MKKQPAQASVIFVDEEAYREPYISWTYALRLLHTHRKLWITLIVLCTLGACLFKGVTDPQITSTMTEMYESSAMLYVSPRNGEEGGDSFYTYDTSSSTLIKNVMQVLEQDSLMSQIAETLDLPSGDEVQEILEVSNPASSSFIELSAITESSEESYEIVKQSLDYLNQTKDTLFPQTVITVLQEPSVSDTAMEASAGSILKTMIKYAILGFAAGVALCILILLCKLIGNRSFRDEKEVQYLFGETPIATGSSASDPAAMADLRAALLMHPENHVTLITGLGQETETAEALEEAMEASRLSSVLLDAGELASQHPDYATLSDFLCSADFSRILEEAAGQKQHVLVSLAGHGESAVLVPAALNADQVLFCVSAAHDTRSDVQKAWSSLQETGVPASIYLYDL